MRYVKGLKQDRRSDSERPGGLAQFSSIDDLAQRCPAAGQAAGAPRAARPALCARWPTRRAALWQVAKVAREAGPLFAESRRTIRLLCRCRRWKTPAPTTRRPRITTSTHVWRTCAARSRAAACSRPTARQRDGDRVTTAGAVIVRQRPGTAKGFVFLSWRRKRDAPAVVHPDLFREQRAVVVGSGALVVKGKLQRQDGSLSVRAERFWTIPEFPDAEPRFSVGFSRSQQSVERGAEGSTRSRNHRSSVTLNTRR